jgi:hypothetical protein
MVIFRGKQKEDGENVFYCQFFHHGSHVMHHRWDMDLRGEIPVYRPALLVAERGD